MPRCRHVQPLALGAEEDQVLSWLEDDDFRTPDAGKSQDASVVGEADTAKKKSCFFLLKLIDFDAYGCALGPAGKVLHDFPLTKNLKFYISGVLAYLLKKRQSFEQHPGRTS